MNIGGTALISAEYKDGTTKQFVVHNKWSNSIMLRILKNAAGTSTGTVPSGNLGDYIVPTQCVVSEYAYEHAASATTIQGTSLTTITNSTRVKTIPSVVSSSTSATDMNASNYPCLLYIQENFGCAYAAGSTEVWDAEAFTVEEAYNIYTFTSAIITAGQTVIPVYDNVSSWRPGSWVYFRDIVYPELSRIQSATSNSITLETGTTYGHASGTVAQNRGNLIYTARAVLTAQLNSGTNTATVDTSTGFVSGGKAMVMDGTNWEKVSISSASGTEIVFDASVSNTYAAGSKILQGFLTPHAASVQTISLNSGAYIVTTDYTFDDTVATAYGTNPIRTIAFRNSENVVTGWILLPHGIYKDASTYLSTLRVYYFYYVVANR